MALCTASGLLACLAVILFQGPVAAQASGGKRTAQSAPTSGAGEQAWQFLPRGLDFPLGTQDFEALLVGRRVTFLEGWVSSESSGGPFTVHAANDVNGAIALRTGSTSAHWLRILDLSPAGGIQSFASASVQAPSAWNYTWRFFINLESPPGNGPARPALMVQHKGAHGFADAWGIEFTPRGANLVIRGIGGDPRSTPLFDIGTTGAIRFGDWIAVELAVELDRRRVSASIDGGAPVWLPIHPRASARLESLRLAYRGEGPGNTLSLLLDDVKLAFGAAACSEDVTFDFETGDGGAPALVNGQDLSTPPEFGDLFAISGAGANLGPAIFDSTSGGPNDPSQDRDLLVNLGNLVILQNTQAPAQTVPGIFDRPNDDQDGGTVFFSFTRPLEPLSVDLVDIDSGIVQSTTVTLSDSGGKTRVYSVPGGWTRDVLANGPPGFGTLDLTTLLPQAGFLTSATAFEDAGFDGSAVVVLSVRFGSSGALDNLHVRAPCVLIDAETEDDGTTPLVNGQDISSPPEFGAFVRINGAGPNLGAAVFDSTPGGPNDPSQDTDLLVGLRNVLILQNSLAPTQSVPGIFDRPNDDQDGGTITFDFVAPVRANRIDLVDIDPGASNSSSVVLTDDQGKKRTFTVPAGWTEDLVDDGGPGFRTLDLRNTSPQPGFTANATSVTDAGFDEEHVVELQVRFGSSGAVDNLCFCP